MADYTASDTRKFLSIILLCAGVLRLWGIWHGYPYSYYPDEAHFVKRALSFGSGDLNPHWFHKPAFFMYVLFFEYGVFFVIGKIAGMWESVGGFAVSYIKNPGPFYIIGRITVAAFGMGVIVVTYLISKTLFNRKNAVFSALILAVSVGHVMVAKDIKADIPCAFFTILSVYFLILYLKFGRTRSILLSAVFAGIGTATKYYSIVMLAPISVALFWNFRNYNKQFFIYASKRFFLCIIVFYLVYFFCSPYNFIDPLGRKETFGKFLILSEKVVKVVKGESTDELREDEKIAESIDASKISPQLIIKGFFSYIGELNKGMGSIVLILSFLGLVLLVRNLNSAIVCFLLFPFLFMGISILIHPGYAEIRHQVIIYPFIAVAAAYSFTLILDKMTAYHQIGYILIVLLLVPLYGSVQYNMSISKKDTRNIAKAWIEKNISPESRLLLDEGGVELMMSRSNIEKNIVKADNADKKGQFTAHYDTYLKYQFDAVKDAVAYDITYIRFPWWRDSEDKGGVRILDSEFDKDMGNPLIPAGVENYGYYIQNGFDYAVVHSYKYNSFLKENAASKKFPSFKRFYTELFQNAPLVKTFTPESYNAKGPVVKIFRFSRKKSDKSSADLNFSGIAHLCSLYSFSDN